MNKSFLKHYGVLGMRWGRRKGSSSSSSDHKSSRSLKKKRLSEMSNDELQKLNKRMQLERTYKDLVSSSSKSAAAKKWVSDVFRDAGKEVAKKYVAQALGKGADSLVDTLLKKK